jgi:hypothetical protein
MAAPRPLPNPFSCQACSTDRWHHGWQYLPSVGLHQWIRPSEARILSRMVARRLARLNSRKDVA